jgi:hypothetical protein
MLAAEVGAGVVAVATFLCVKNYVVAPTPIPTCNFYHHVDDRIFTLDDDHPLDRLHSRFWGTEEDAKERLTPAPCNNNRKSNETPGKGDESEDVDKDSLLKVSKPKPYRRRSDDLDDWA